MAAVNAQQVPAAPPVFTVRDAIAVCGVDNVTQRNGATNEFETCLDITMDDLMEAFKNFADLRQNQGQIKLTVRMKKKIKGFIQWTRDELRMGREPKNTAYPVTDLRKQEVRMKTHQEFVKTSDTLSEAAKPKEFTNDSKWEDWEPIFSKYLRCLVGRNGVPLSYVIRDQEAGDPTPHQDFKQMYINMAPLNGDAYVIDNGRVLTLLDRIYTSTCKACI